MDLDSESESDSEDYDGDVQDIQLGDDIEDFEFDHFELLAIDKTDPVVD